MKKNPASTPVKKPAAPPPAETAKPPRSAEFDLNTLVRALSSLKRGDFSVRLPEEWTGAAGRVANTFNDVVELNDRMAQELDRISHVVGRQGRINQRASLGDVSGSWRSSVGDLNNLIANLVHPTSEMARVIGAVAKG
ncbi:MAG: hypothetical protein ACO1QR_08865, partial [Chthoniobacteraceae bacterium]